MTGISEEPNFPFVSTMEIEFLGSSLYDKFIADNVFPFLISRREKGSRQAKDTKTPQPKV